MKNAIQKAGVDQAPKTFAGRLARVVIDTDTGRTAALLERQETQDEHIVRIRQVADRLQWDAELLRAAFSLVPVDKPRRIEVTV
jgi:hypothetical protein